MRRSIIARNALTICESLAEAFLSHFRERGFKLALPPRSHDGHHPQGRRVLSVPAGRQRRARLVGGHYDLETNRLVVFDFRAHQEELGANPELVNLFTLIHEAIHMLCLQYGHAHPANGRPCLHQRRAGDLRRAVALEGQGKDRRHQRRTAEGLDRRTRLGASWIPIADLLANDACLKRMTQRRWPTPKPGSWCTTCSSGESLPRFRAYLAKLPESRRRGRRLKFAEAELGSLENARQGSPSSRPGTDPQA